MLEQQTKKNSTVIVIPIYKSNLSLLEQQSLEQAYKILKHYPMVVIKPENLDLDQLVSIYPNLQLISFPNHFFENIAGYNTLMMSEVLYERFMDLGHSYMLIYQLDAYIFEDKLDYFVSKDYDYIGAPVLERKLYQIIPILKKIKTSKKKYRTDAITWEQNNHSFGGNGGLSLRKIKSHYDICIRYKDKIEVYKSHQNISSVFNEDTFWTREPHEFKYPTLEDALKFSFDKYPQLCLEKNNNQLPMGCHAWYKWKWKSFWVKYITFAEQP